MITDLSRPQQGQATRVATTQTVASVARAEVAKVLAPGGLRTWWLVAVGLGLAGGIGSVFLANVSDLQEVLSMSVSASVSAGPLIVLTVVAIATAGYVPREISDGTIVTAKRLVPRTDVLFFGRLLGWSAGASVPIATTAVAPMLFALLNPAVLRSGAFETGAALLLAIVVPTLTIVLVHVGATILRRGAYIVAVTLTLLFFLPLLLGLGGVMMPGIVAVAAQWINAALIGTLIVQATSVPSDSVGTWATTLQSLLGVLGWVAATTAIAYRQFSAPGYGE